MRSGRKGLRYLPFVLGAALVIFAFVNAFAVRKANRDYKEFLAGYGWQVALVPIEEERITIPDIFDNVYNNYNDIQRENGMDLEPYKGKSVLRITYKVLNYPGAEGQEIRANILVYEGRVIAGDIMSTAIDGFMHGLGSDDGT